MDRKGEKGVNAGGQGNFYKGNFGSSHFEYNALGVTLWLIN